MKKIIYIISLLLIVSAGCSKKEQVSTSGTETINNTTYMSATYYVFGFSFSTGKQVTTLTTPGPDITVFVNSDLNSSRLIFQANNLRPSFYKAGEYTDENAAIAAFNNLKSVQASSWLDLAEPVNPNQIWIYRSGEDKYSKIRIISTLIEKRQNLGQEINYGECTFQWVHQPDGSLTFP
jgi:hypothetical protein